MIRAHAHHAHHAHCGLLRRKSGGSTIVEVLVALLVVAVGVIGVAAVYRDNAHVRPDGQLRLQASRLAESMAERVRHNREGRTGYAHTIGVVCDPDARLKTAHDKAAMEAACWASEVERSLPSGAGSITRDATTHPVTYVVAVSWSPPGGGAASYVVRVAQD